MRSDECGSVGVRRYGKRRTRAKAKYKRGQSICPRLSVSRRDFPQIPCILLILNAFAADFTLLVFVGLAVKKSLSCPPVSEDAHMMLNGAYPCGYAPFYLGSPFGRAVTEGD